MNTRTTLILAVCLVAVGLYMAFVAKPWQEDKKPAAAPKSQDVWAEKPKTEDIERVEVDSTRFARRVFVKKDDKWLIETPIHGSANKWQVDDIVREVVELKSVRSYAKGAEGRPSDATTKLDKPPFTVTLTTKDKKTLALWIGERSPTGGDTYVQKVGSDDVLVADKNLHTTLDRRLSDIRDKRVIDLKMEDVVRVKVEGAESFELVKSGGEWMLESPVRGRADKTKAEAVARTLTSLYVSEFETDKPASLWTYGLDRPRLTATVTTERTIEKKGDPTSTNPAETQPSVEKKQEQLVLQFGSPTDAKGEYYFARIGGEDPVFRVAKSAFTDAGPKLNDLREKQIARIDTAKSRKIEVTIGAQSFVLEKKGNQWHYADGTEAEVSLVEDLLKAMRDLKVTEFPNRDTLFGVNVDKPRAKVSVTQEGEPAPVTLLVLGQTASQKNAYVKIATDDSIGVVPEESVASLLAEPISYRKRDMVTFVRDHANRIEVTRGGESALLTKTGAAWAMVSPIAAPADTDAVRDLLTDLSALRAKKVVGKGDAARFGLDKPAVTVAVTVQAPPPPSQPASEPASRPDKPGIEELRRKWQESHPGEPLPPDLMQEVAATQAAAPSSTQPAATVPATKPAVPPPPPPKTYRVFLARKGNEAYAMVDGSDLVYQVDTGIYDHLTAELRDRTVAKFDVAAVKSLSLVRPGEEMEFAQADNKWSYRQDNTVAIDDQKVKDVLNAIRDARVHRYVRHKAAAADLAAYKLDAPALRVIVVTNGNVRVELLISADGPADDTDKSRYATVVGSEAVYLLKGEQCDKLQKTLADFLKTDKPAPPPPSGGFNAGGE